MTDFSKDFKKSAAKSFIESKYSPARFCVTFSNRNIDPMLLIEWVKDLAISVQANAEYWQNQANNQAVIIERLDAEKEALNLKVCKLAEDNAKLAMANINSGITAINNKTNTYVATTLQNEEIQQLKNRISTLTDVNMRYCQNEEKLITTNQQLQSENQSLMSEIEELKSISGHRDNMQFIAICQKIVQDAEELQKHLEGGK